MKPPLRREYPERVFEQMLTDYFIGFEQGIGRPATERERAEKRAQYENGPAASWRFSKPRWRWNW